MRYLVKVVMLVWWVCGIVIAKGFWSTTFAFFIPFWAWYLSIEAVIKNWGLV